MNVYMFPGMVMGVDMVGTVVMHMKMFVFFISECSAYAPDKVNKTKSD